MSNVGQILRSKREEQGVTLKDVEATLSIRVKYLEALEHENYAVIPGEVYVKGFLRNYANYLGLDAEEMVRLYKNDIRPAANTETETTEEKASVPPAKQEKGPTFVFGIGVAVVLLIIAGTVYFVYSQITQNTPPNKANVPPISTAPVPRTPAHQTPSAQNIPPSPDTVKPAVREIVLSLKARADCWVLVLADGREIFEGILKNGDIKTWQAKNKMEITLGNAGGVEITYNNQPQAPLGGEGEVVRKVYTLP